MTTPGWHEVYDGGSSEAEREANHALAGRMLRLQAINQTLAGAGCPARTLHARMTAGVINASVTVDADLPDDFAVGWCRPEARLTATIRFSNASGVPRADAEPDMRGVAIRLALPEGGIHDLLMTSYPVSHARNARQFVEFAEIASGDRATLVARMVAHFGEAEATRMLTNIAQGVGPCASLALQAFWSRGAVLWGAAPVRFALYPAADAPPAAADLPDQGLEGELAARLRRGDVRFRLALQRYVDAQATPIEDAAAQWHDDVTPPIGIATLTIPAQDLFDEQGRAQAAHVDRLAFNPWNAPPAFRPLGNINRAREQVYRASAERWLPTTDDRL